MNQTIRGGDLARYRALLAVADQGSFARAAASLGLSAPALSQSIRALEEQLGMQLFRRTTRSVTATEQGAELVARLRPVLRELDEVIAAARTSDSAPRGTVRLSVPHIATNLVGGWLGRFTAKYPDVIVDVTVDDALVDIVADRFDAGVRLGERLARDMVAIPAGGALSMAAVASPGYLRERGTPRSPRELQDHRCINVRMPTLHNVYRWEFERRGRGLEVSVQGPCVVTDTRLAVRAALAGVGIAYVLDELVLREVSQGRLVRLLEDWSPSFPGMYLYYPKHRHLPLAVKAFVDFVRTEHRDQKSRRPRASA